MDRQFSDETPEERFDRHVRELHQSAEIMLSRAAEMLYHTEQLMSCADRASGFEILTQSDVRPIGWREREEGAA